MNARQKRGRAIAANSKIERGTDGVYLVPSSGGMGTYSVTIGEVQVCTCLDFQGTKKPCKHVFAAEFFAKKTARMATPQVAAPKPPSLIELAMRYDTNAKCIELLEFLRWPEGPVCPRCNSQTAYRLQDRRLFECGDCTYQYSVIVGTVMQDTRLPLCKWILAIALLCNARKGVSACQVSRDLHVTYKTAWYLCHRIRRAMRESEWLKKFTGIVEVDETYLGGKARGPGSRGRSGVNKTVIFGAKERGGKVRMQAIPNVTSKTLDKVVHEYVDTDAEMVMADQFSSYNQLAAEFTMERINHTREYVRGEIHTQGIESVWAILKRQSYGTHHRMKPAIPAAVSGGDFLSVQPSNRARSFLDGPAQWTHDR